MALSVALRRLPSGWTSATTRTIGMTFLLRALVAHDHDAVLRVDVDEVAELVVDAVHLGDAARPSALAHRRAAGGDEAEDGRLARLAGLPVVVRREVVHLRQVRRALHVRVEAGATGSDADERRAGTAGEGEPRRCCDEELLHQMTFASFLSFSTSVATSGTLMPALRAG